MSSEQVVIATVVAIGGFLSIWGASLVVRALASRAWSGAAKLARRIPKRINTAPPTLSRLQFWFGMIVGPIACVLGAALIALILGLITLEGEINVSWGAIAAFFIAMMACGVLVVGLRWDRAKGRRRCPRCWYDYAGLANDAPCPECGGVPASAQSLGRTRRNRTLIRLAPALLIVAWVAVMTPEVLRVGWRGAIPSTLLIATFEHLPTTLIRQRGFGDDGTLSARIWHDRLSDGQRAWLGRRSLRVLQTTDDLDACETATMIFASSSYYATGADASPDELDKANANMIRVALQASHTPANALRAQMLLSQAFLSTGPRTRQEIAEHLDAIVARYAASTAAGEQIALAALLARFAPATPEVLEAARKVAFDPTASPDAHDAACVALGMIIARDRAVNASLIAEYETSSGRDREILATAIAGTLVDPELSSIMGAWAMVSARAENTTSRLLGVVTSGDPDLRNGAIAALRATPWITRASLDRDAMTPTLIEVAQNHPESRRQAIATLVSYGDMRPDLIPVLAEMARDGDATDVSLVTQACQSVPMDPRWKPVLEAVRERLGTPHNEGTGPESAGPESADEETPATGPDAATTVALIELRRHLESRIGP